MKTSTVLKRALRLLDGGRRWIKGVSRGSKAGVRGECYCSMGAIEKALAGKGAFMPVCDVFDAVIGTNATALWNDAPHRRWSHVEAAFKRAIKLAEKEERR